MCVGQQAVAQPSGALDGAEDRLDASRLQLTAIRKENQLRSGSLAAPHQCRETGQGIDGARNRDHRRDQGGPGLVELTADFDLSRLRQQWPPADLLQVHPHQVDIRALDPLLGRFADQPLGSETVLIVFGQGLGFEGLGILDRDEQFRRTVERF